ncbi:MAG: YggS family pyridoxal phosphate-dependent enzyme [Verrucomicrobiae bacterium]|nr:YggS family pyridoxal phosphate-dependent enzyme [Verrucomicrobiae bacterium]
MIEERYREILRRISSACERAGRRTEEVTLVAVSKTHPPESVNELARLGHRNFGENKMQEGRAKIPLCNGNLRWHMIGHLQTNKARDVVRLFSMVQAVDSLRLAQELEKHADQQSRHLDVLLEVNVSGEGSKFGIQPGQLIPAALEINRLPHLELQGLMTMAPFSDNPEDARPHFRRLAQLKRDLEKELGAPLPHLSMGMSGDFEVGIEEGATLIRVGTAIFGERPKPQMPTE